MAPIPPMSKTAVPIVFGAMTIGNGAEQSRVKDISEAEKILDIFQSHGHNEVDTSRVYGAGTSEEYLGKLGWQKRGLVMDTKLYPTAGKGVPGDQVSHSPEDLRRFIQIQLKALNTDKVDMWYLHAPDRTVPFIDTLREVNALHQEGLFTHFGLSNYQAWEVAQICEITRSHNWIQPTVYQGVYNALNRTIEAELLPCLRHYGMGFYAFNPLGGGFFTGGFTREGSVEKGSRFDAEQLQGRMYRARYYHDDFFEAMELVKPVAEKYGLSLAEVALRWMTHHSMLGREFRDAILIGASSTRHIEQNLVDLEKGGLPEEVVGVLNEGWGRTRRVTGKYWH